MTYSERLELVVIDSSSWPDTSSASVHVCDTCHALVRSPLADHDAWHETNHTAPTDPCPCGRSMDCGSGLHPLEER